jgi:Family of unknown function (DUF7019)
VSFRYYLYVSDAKVDMLVGQIDPRLTRRRTAEVGLNLKVFGAKRTVESAGAERSERLERVVRYLEEHGDLGSVDEPGQFFWGLLPMRWGPFPPASVYFGGASERTVVGLGGSAHHVLGSPPPGTPAPGPPRSMAPGLLADLAGDEIQVADEAAALSMVRRVTGALTGPTQNLEFVAKRLLSGDVDGQPVLLGSPLYVAMVD